MMIFHGGWREDGLFALGDAGRVLWAVGAILGAWMNTSHIHRCVFLPDRDTLACQMVAQRGTTSWNL